MTSGGGFGATFGNSKGFNMKPMRTSAFDDSFDADSRGSDFGFNDDIKEDLHRTRGKRGHNDVKHTNIKGQAPPLKLDRRQTTTAEYNRGPPIRTSISDIVDQSERDAVFQSSIRPGGFMAGGSLLSPPGQSMTPFLMSPKTPIDRNSTFNMSPPRLNVEQKPSDHFKKFVPRSEKQEFKKKMLDEVKDFVYMPKKFMCPKHKETEIEFCCQINETFYCKLCMPSHSGHDDIVLAEVCKQLQEDVIKLKHTYIAKKEFIINKLDTHQSTIENIFKVYYDTLDELRNQVLGQEYKLRMNMDYFETTIAVLMKDIRQYNYIEFYHEQDLLKQKIREIKDSLKAFNIYMPKYSLAVEDINLAINQIKVDIRERVYSFMRETNHQFSLGNYDYMLNVHSNEQIAKIYKQFGPFDFYSQKVDEESLEVKTMVDKFDKRKSGANFRGEISSMTGKPDGRGIKVFPNGSIYEGYFSDGHCHGIGRGVTSRGEVYQGQFEFDQMEGKGFFQWPDGRMYEGDWKGGKKNGKGKFFWPNGQVYDGEFKDNECNGNGILHYPDGKRLEGIWKNGKKHGKAVYIWPNGARYNIFYIDGKKQGEGLLEGANVSLEQLKESYRSLAKKSLAGKDLMTKPRGYFN